MGVTDKGYGVSLEGGGRNENVLKLVMVMATQFCEYTEETPNCTVKYMNSVVCELHLNRTMKKKRTTALEMNFSRSVAEAALPQNN